MLKKIMKFLSKDEKGITGLETAIILIAFVVVAAVFAYTVLSAGLFSTQKSSQAVYNALNEASNTIETRGSLIAYQGDTNIDDSVGKVEFTVTVSTSKGVQGIDLTAPYTYDAVTGLTLVSLNTPTQISFIDSNISIPRCAWTLSWVGKHLPATGDYLLEAGEQAVITVWLHDYTGDPLAWADGTEANGFLGTNIVDTYHQFNLEVKTPSGAVLTMQRTTPAMLDTVMDLH